jgi:uncharacterized membrane protein
MSYTAFKLMHLLGVVLLLGNIVVTAAWKLAADRHGNPAVVAFAQRMVMLADFAFTLPGIALTLVGAHGMGWLGGFSLWQPGWLAWGHSLFIVSGVIWLGVLVPTQVQQGRLAASFATSPAIPARYWQLNRRWIVWGVAATVLPVINMGLMVLKPE